MTASLLWFRRDLRLRDLPAMLDAAEGDTQVLACFVLDPRLEASSGPRRLQFLGDALRELDEGLGGRLLIIRGRPEQVIPQLCSAIGAHHVHISADFSPFGVRRDAAVAAALGADGAELIATGSPYLVSPGRVTKDDGTPYKVFTPFFNRWREVGWRAPAQSDPAAVQWIDPFGIAGIPQRCEAPNPAVALELPAGETAARSGLTGREFQCHSGIRGLAALWDAGYAERVDPLHRCWIALCGCAPSDLAPPVEEWGEDLVGGAVVLGDPAR